MAATIGTAHTIRRTMSATQLRPNQVRPTGNISGRRHTLNRLLLGRLSIIPAAIPSGACFRSSLPASHEGLPGPQGVYSATRPISVADEQSTTST